MRLGTDGGKTLSRLDIQECSAVPRRFAPVVGSWLRHTRSQGGYRGQPPPPPLPPPQQPPPAPDQEPGYGGEEEQEEELDLHGDKVPQH